MNNFYLNSIIEDDFVWNAVTSSISGRARRSRTGFIEINCPMCNDYKPRCGIKKNGDGVGFNCYNCNFKTRWKTGTLLGEKLKRFLTAVGMSDIEISKLNYKAFQYRSLLKASPEAALLIPDFALPNFHSMALPKGSKSFDQLAKMGCEDPDFLAAVNYMLDRGEEIFSGANFYWTPLTDSQLNRRVIIPCYYENRVVGYSARAIDSDNRQRYQMHVPTNFLYNSAALSNPGRKYAILTEGILDAVALDCVGLLGARLNNEQIAWIKSYGKTIILLADRDTQGQELIDVAVKQGWHIAFPRTGARAWWERDVKDAAEAVRRYGSIWTLLSVVETATNNSLKINVQRKLLKNQKDFID